MPEIHITNSHISVYKSKNNQQDLRGSHEVMGAQKVNRIAVYNNMIQNPKEPIYLAPALENLVTDLVPSEIACFESSPGRIRRTAVWISREEMVDFLEYAANLEASVAIRSKMSLTKEFKIAIALLEIPVSGCTCFNTL